MKKIYTKNKIFQKLLIQYGRKMASKGIDELAKQAKLQITTNEIIRLKNYH